MSNNPVNCVVAVNAIVVYEDKIMLLKHNRPEKAKDKYGFPGGKVEQGETFIQALIREIQEEVGIDIEEENIQKLCILHDFPETTCKHIYLVSLKSFMQNFIFDSNEIQSIEWLERGTIKDINVNDFRNDRVFKLLLDYVNGKFNNTNFVYTLE